MLLFLVLFLTAGAVAAAIVAISELLPGGSRARALQLGMLDRVGRGPGAEAARPAPSLRLRAVALLVRIGRSMPRLQRKGATAQELLTQSGYRRPDAPAIYSGGRTSALIALPLAVGTLSLVAGLGAGASGFVACWAAALGWLAPTLYLRGRIRARRREIDRALPDALDLVVVCVEAGLGLNQALARMAEEIRHFSPATSDEFRLVNLEMRAGVPRVEALRSLGTRMGVPELRTLATMLIQADRFGTSVAQALRVHAETSRTKRRQRAEEAAAKTTIKLMFPLVLCIFPTIFVVVLGPAIIGIIRTLAGM